MERLSVNGTHQMRVSTNAGPRIKTFIDEKNLYRLIGRSDKPQASSKKYQWKLRPSMKLEAYGFLLEFTSDQGLMATCWAFLYNTRGPQL